MTRGRKPNNMAGTGGQAPDPPQQLSQNARIEWRRVMPLLVRGGVVQRVDQAIVATYCETVVLWRRLTLLLDEAMLDLADKKPPVYTMWLETSKQLRGLCDQLAFTPAARKQIITGAAKTDALEDALKG